LEPIFITRLRDDDFESPPGTIPTTLGPDPWPYLRLVANPFLGFYGVVLWFYVLGHMPVPVIPGANWADLLVVLGVVFLLPRLFQFHCLDCHATGRLGRWKQHVCPASAARRRENRPRRWPGIGPGMQVILWLIPAGMVSIAVHLFCLGLR